MRKTKKRELLLNFSLLIASILIFLFIFEVILYLVGYDNQYGAPRGLFVPDDYLDYHMNPGFHGIVKQIDCKYHVDINKDGFRDYEHNLSKSNYRIMALGDSQTYGNGVEFNETFLYLLENKLQKRLKNIEIFKMGVPGYGTDNEWFLFRKYYPKYKPDVLLLVFHPNDVLDNIQWGEKYINKKKETALMRFFLVHSYLRKKLKFYDFIYMRFRNLPLIKKLKIDVRFAYDYRYLFLNVDTKATKEGFENSFKYLNKFINASYNDEFELVVVIVTCSHQFWDSSKKSLEEYANRLNTTINITKVSDLLSDYFAARNITVIDIFDEFSKYPTPGGLFLPLDGHWNSKGHKLAADVIYKKLINKSILQTEEYVKE